MARLKFKDCGGGAQLEDAERRRKIHRIKVVGKMMTLELRWRILAMKRYRGEPKQRQWRKYESGREDEKGDCKGKAGGAAVCEDYRLACGR
jgi:hypothetical protein